MAAATVYGNNFDANGNPTGGRPFDNNIGNTTSDTDVVTIATTSIDDAGDRIYLFAVPEGVTIEVIEDEHADLDSNGTPTLDADWILNEVVGGVSTDTIIYNKGTAFQSATSLGAPERRLCDQAVVKKTDSGYALVGILVNTPAATAASGELRARIVYRSPA